jgi:hypothetical protein
VIPRVFSHDYLLIHYYPPLKPRGDKLYVHPVFEKFFENFRVSLPIKH